MKLQRSKPRNNKVLFLLRAYNDLDHISPVIWKIATDGHQSVSFLFVGTKFRGDYRVKLVEEAGAKELISNKIDFYYRRLRPKLKVEFIQKILDRFIGMYYGRQILTRNRVSCIVTEWGGPDGKGMAPYYLRPARAMGLPTIAIPHGYHTWINNDFNVTTSYFIQKTGKLPQFRNRNLFTAYVVQSDNIKRYCIQSGIDKEKLIVLGSARFCKEWSAKNQLICQPTNFMLRHKNRIVVLFFLNHWDYNVDRKGCLNLLKRIAGENVELIIKGHTRGQSGGLTQLDENELAEYDSVRFAGNNVHSPELVGLSNLVIVYGSSICFEALRQHKPVCRPSFICNNTTIFDDPNVTFDAKTDDDVISYIRGLRTTTVLPSNECLRKFFAVHVENGENNKPVLESYMELINTQVRKHHQLEG